MGTVSEGGRERRAEIYVRFVPGKGTRSWGINLQLDVSIAVTAQWSKMEGTSLAEWPENKFSFQHQFMWYIQSGMRHSLIVI